MDDNEININFWIFQKLIVEHPERYLNEKGRVIYRLVEDNGLCTSQQQLSSETNLSKQRISMICKELEAHGFIVRIKNNGTNNAILFHDSIVDKTYSFARGILKNGKTK